MKIYASYWTNRLGNMTSYFHGKAASHPEFLSQFATASLASAFAPFTKILDWGIKAHHNDSFQEKQFITKDRGMLFWAPNETAMIRGFKKINDTRPVKFIGDGQSLGIAFGAYSIPKGYATKVDGAVRIVGHNALELLKRLALGSKLGLSNSVFRIWLSLSSDEIQKVLIEGKRIEAAKSITKGGHIDHYSSFSSLTTNKFQSGYVCYIAPSSYIHSNPSMGATRKVINDVLTFGDISSLMSLSNPGTIHMFRG